VSVGDGPGEHPPGCAVYLGAADCPGAAVPVVGLQPALGSLPVGGWTGFGMAMPLGDASAGAFPGWRAAEGTWGFFLAAVGDFAPCLGGA
jgi:hypothetical protein